MITIQDIKRAYTTNLKDIFMNGLDGKPFVDKFFTLEEVDIILGDVIKENEKIFKNKSSEKYLKELAYFINEMEREDVFFSLVDESRNQTQILSQLSKRKEEIHGVVFNIYSSLGKAVFFKNDNCISNKSDEILKIFVKGSCYFKSTASFHAVELFQSKALNKYIMNLCDINEEVKEDKKLLKTEIQDIEKKMSFLSSKNLENSNNIKVLKEIYKELVKESFIIKNIECGLPLILTKIIDTIFKKYYDDKENVEGLYKEILESQPLRFNKMMFLKGFVEKFSEQQKDEIYKEIKENRENPMIVSLLEIMKERYIKKGPSIIEANFINNDGMTSITEVDFSEGMDLLLNTHYLENQNQNVRRGFDGVGENIYLRTLLDTKIRLVFNNEVYKELNKDNIVDLVYRAINNASSLVNEKNKNLDYRNKEIYEEYFEKEFDKVYREYILLMKIEPKNISVKGKLKI